MIRKLMMLSGVVISLGNLCTFAEEAIFKETAVKAYEAMQKALREKADLRLVVNEYVDMRHMCLQASKRALSGNQVAILRDSVERFARHLLGGEAIRSVIKFKMNKSRMTATLKKTVTFIECELLNEADEADATKLVIIFLKKSRKIIDIRCAGISFIKILEVVISKYCASKKINFESTRIEDRLNIIKEAIINYTS
jgi:hypothetical protein